MIAPVRPQSPVSTTAATRRTGEAARGGRFSAPPADTGQAASGSRGVVATRSVTSLDAVMALQGVDDPAGRRARAVRRGARLLDDLDDLKIGLHDGRLSEGRLGRLMAAVDARRDQTDDAGLEDVLDGIELRARVELAKLGR